MNAFSNAYGYDNILAFSRYINRLYLENILTFSRYINLVCGKKSDINVGTDNWRHCK